MSLRIAYTRPTASVLPVAHPSQAIYSLGAAGAAAAVELDDRYRLILDGVTGLGELRLQVESLIDVLRSGKQMPGDDQLRAALLDVPVSAILHSWHFSSYMYEIPVIVFAIDGPVTRIYTRTLSEVVGNPLVITEDRDLADVVEIPTASLLDEAKNFIDQVDHDIATLIDRAEPESKQ
jgi:hypothetical protein